MFFTRRTGTLKNGFSSSKSEQSVMDRPSVASSIYFFETILLIDGINFFEFSLGVDFTFNSMYGGVFTFCGFFLFWSVHPAIFSQAIAYYSYNFGFFFCAEPTFRKTHFFLILCWSELPLTFDIFLRFASGNLPNSIGKQNFRGVLFGVRIY